MATPSWRKLPDLIRDLLQNSSKYNFFQAIRILEKEWLTNDLSTTVYNKQLQLQASSEINFPAADIQKCTLDLGNSISLYLTFMGLYGVDSTLPHYFITYAFTNNPHGECIREFLNIFNNRIYSLFYLAWRKYYPAANLDNYCHYLKSLSGFSLLKNDDQEFSFAALLGNRIHNSAGLTGLISDYLDGAPTQIQQFIPAWIRVENINPLGKTPIILGENVLLGDKVVTTTQKIKLTIGPLTSKAALQLFPGTKKQQQLAKLIQRYLKTLSCDLEIIIASHKQDHLKLGHDTIRLGWISWLGCLNNNPNANHTSVYIRNFQV